MRPFLCAPLILIALVAAQPASAGEAAAAPVTKAQELMRSRKPKEAIPQLVQLINEKRDTLEESTDALIQLVTCFQLLKGDAAAEAQYAELAAKYLSKPPPLDGKSLPTVDEASEDLLWKGWMPGQPSRFGFLLGAVERTIKMEQQDGPSVHTLEIKFAVEDSSPAANGKTDRETEMMEAMARREPDPAKAARMRKEILMEQARGHGAKLASADGDGLLGSAGKASVRIGDKHYEGSAKFWSGWVTVTIAGLPIDAKVIDEVTANLHLSQPRQIDETMVPLRKGASWNSGGEAGTITDVATQGNKTTVKCSSKPTGGKADRGGDSTTVTAGGMSMATAGAGGGNEAPDTEAPFCLVTPDGKTFTPRGSNMSSHNGNATMTFTFQGAEKADRLRVRKTATLSVREVPLSVQGIKLP